jgi:hypothetical protein
MTFVADFNEDGNVDSDDLDNWQVGFGSLNTTHMQGDADGDGDSDGRDFLAWQLQVGSGVTAASTNIAIPEPSNFMLWLAAFACFFSTRRLTIALPKSVSLVDSAFAARKVQNMDKKSFELVDFIKKDKVPERVSGIVKENDVVLILGAGDIRDVSGELVEKIREKIR